MKKSIACCMLIILCLSLFAGCSSGAPDTGNPSDQTPQTTAAEETTEPKTVYTEQSVWLRTRTTSKNHDRDDVFVTEYYYDDYGRLIEEVNTKSGGQPTGRREYFYDENGILIEMIAYDDANTKTYTYSYEYDDEGNRVGETAVKDGEIRWRTTWVFSPGGYIMEEKTTSSRGVDHFVYEYNEDKSERTEYRVDGDSRWISSVTELGLNNVELKSTAYNSKGKKTSVRTFSYGENGLESIDVNHYNSSTASDYVIYYTYDEYGNLVKDVADYYYGSTSEHTYELVTILVAVND